MSMNDNRTMSEKREQYMVEVMGRLVDAINRSSEVMNSAINTIETLAAPSPNKTSVPDDDSVLINSKRNDKVINHVQIQKIPSGGPDPGAGVLSFFAKFQYIGQTWVFMHKHSLCHSVDVKNRG